MRTRSQTRCLKNTFVALSLVSTFLWAAGCKVETKEGGQSDKKGAGQKGDPVANVGGTVITTEDFKAKLDEQSPFIRARYTTLERKKEFLDNLIRFEVLAAEAERRGLKEDPEVQSTIKKVMVQKLIRAEFDENEAAKNIPEEELKKYYDEHLDEYVKPERVRVSHIFLAAEKGDPRRDKIKGEANKILADVKTKEAGPDKVAFMESARLRSDDAATKALGGDLSFKTIEELTSAWGTAFAAPTFDMKTIGDIGSLIETDKGFHLVKLTGRQAALDRPFDQVKSQIQNRLYREKRTKAFDEFVATLKTKANVQIHDAVLDKIEVMPPGSPNPAMPQMPGMPPVPVAEGAPPPPASATAQAPTPPPTSPAPATP